MTDEYKQQLESLGIKTLIGYINEESANDIINWILYMNLIPISNKPNRLKIIIDSQGGNIEDTFAIIDTIRF